MMGRIVVVAVLLCAALAGAGLYYFQVHAFYERLPAQDSVALTPLGAVGPQQVAIEAFRGIDSDSSPIRYRACFTLSADPAQFTPYPEAIPLNAPRWFDCFDAAALGAALDRGAARAILGQRDIRPGIDRVVAVLPDGRGFAWHQINRCGRALFDGDPPPPGCPAPPPSTR